MAWAALSSCSTRRLRRALPAARPRAQLEHRRAQIGALLGQRVDDPGRRALLDLALDDAGLLELAQPLGEKPVGEAGNGFGELAEAQRPLGQRRDDRAGPTLADQLDRGVKMGADSLGLSGGGYS